MRTHGLTGYLLAPLVLATVVLLAQLVDALVGAVTR